MKKAFLSILVLVPCLLAAVAWADWNPGDPAKWVQEPDLTELGIDVNASEPYVLADDFLCEEEGLITGIHIWGSWFQDMLPGGLPENVAFTLSIHKDIPADQSPTGYSMPGELLWMRTFQPGEFVARIYGPDQPEGWMDPPDQYLFPGDFTCWQYNFMIDPADAFYQTGSPDEPVIYWLDVQAMPFFAEGRFGWKTSIQHWNDDAVWGQGPEPFPGPWDELFYPPGHEQQGQSIDLSFVFHSEPVPQDIDYGDAPDGVAAPGYPTLLANNGGRHIIGGPWFCDAAGGDFPDPEPDGQPDPNALGDDNDGNDDENGVAIPIMTQGQVATIQFMVCGGGGFVGAWIDWDGDQTWSTTEKIVSGVFANGVHNVNVVVPNSSVIGQTFARFRISSTDSLIYPYGLARDGEVEDYEVFIEEAPQTYKWEQRPDLTPTGIDVNDTEPYILADDFLCTQTGRILEIYVWGSWLDDHYPFQEDPMAVRFTLSFHSDIPAGPNQEYSMPGDVLWMRQFLPGSFTAEVFASNIEEGWMDPPDYYFFPADWTCWLYKFTIPEDEAFLQMGTPENPRVYWLDVQAAPEDTTAVFGWKTSLEHWNDDAVWGQGFEPFPGPWRELRYPPNHELAGQSIDLAFRLFGVEVPLEYDFGDAPDPTFPTWQISGGAYHAIDYTIFMGNSIDPEPDGQPDPTALGDDNDGNDDEDGVTFATVLRPGAPQVVNVLVSVNGFIDAWVDFHGDGSWATPGDQVFASAPVTAGPNALVFNVPPTGNPGQNIITRWRFSTAGGLPYTGFAQDGEVEDHEVFIEDDMTGLQGSQLPQRFELYAAAPNPFNPMATIRFDLPTPQHVKLTVYAVDGRKIATVVNESMVAGEHTVVWNGRSDAGQAVASGTYFYRIEAGTFSKVLRMTLIK